ncbi:MAG: hypothetical protein OXC46_02200 [Thaumarchaeota archaeon]|nr:hypothetical protein [Nitrososphaerota archaeon]
MEIEWRAKDRHVWYDVWNSADTHLGKIGTTAYTGILRQMQDMYCE